MAHGAGSVAPVRVIAGTARGRRIEAPRGHDVRPTSDRAREALFNRLMSLYLIDGAHVADVFAGSGALGIEALSRGAASATFVDSDPKAIAAIRSNLATLGFVGDVIRSSAAQWVQATRTVFDVAFCDPPYAFDDWNQLLEALPAHWVVVESDRLISPPDSWVMVKSSKYGRAVISVLERPDGYRLR